MKALATGGRRQAAGAIRRVACALSVSLLALRLSAAAPTFEISASSTNLVVTEETTISLRLLLPALDEPFGEQPPILNQRPPHMDAAFLAPDWNPAALTATDAKRLFAGNARRGRNAPSFTLNDYVSDNLLGGMSDPFGMFDDDFFGRPMLGPRKVLFPFDAERVKVDGRRMWRFTVATMPYRAVAPGVVTISPVRLAVPLITSVRSGKDRFGRPVNIPNFRELKLSTRPLSITVAAPPETGRPASYCGAICSNLTARAALDTNICTAGDPLVFTLDVSGPEDLSSIHPPKLADLMTNDVFRVDDASVKTDTFSGFRRFTWRVRAIKAGTVEFPSLPVSCYDLTTRRYRTVRTESIPIQVRAGAQAALGALDEVGGETEELPMPDGIDLDERGALPLPLLPHLALSLTLLVVPPLVFLLIRLAPPVRRRVAARNAAYRRATAFARCRRALRSRDADRRREAIRRFFSVRYGVNGAAVTAADAERLMAPDFSAEEISCVADALAEMDRTEYAERKTITPLVVLLAAALGCAGTSMAASASPDFTYRRASVLATRAADEAGFRAAATAYADCVNAGAANPTVFANLGACALLAGDANAARDAFARAERWGGESPTTRRGLLAAAAHRTHDPRAELPLARTFLRPHFLFPLDMRFLFAAVVWAFIWLVALLPPGAARRFLLFCGACLFLAAALSVSVSLVEEHLYGKGAAYAQG